MLTPASLIGSQVYQVSFDYQTTFELFHQEDSGAIRVHAHLVIFTPFVLRSRDGTIHNLDPETSRAALAPVIDLFLGTIRAVTVDGNDTVEFDGNGNPISRLGTLILDFADGAQLTVPPSDTYQSWDLYGDGAPGSRIRRAARRLGLGSRLKPRLRGPRR